MMTEREDHESPDYNEELSDYDRILIGRYFAIPESNRLLQRLIGTLSQPDELINIYSDIIDRYFSSLLGRPDAILQYAYPKIRLESVSKALEELWVVRAGKRETFRIFLDFETFENLLFQSADYRAHYIHQFDVFLLGYYILNKILENCPDISEQFRISRNPNFTWMLAATFHDMGYPVERIDEWFSNFLKTFLKSETPYQIEIDHILSPIFFEYLRYLSGEHYCLKRGTKAIVSNSFPIDWKFHNALYSNLLKKDHGVISSLLLIHCLLTQERITRFKQWFIGTFPYEVLPACHAISIHNIKMEKTKISLQRYPYAFLLVLCDALQDWERSSGHKDYSELTDIKADFSKSVPLLEFSLRTNVSRKSREIKECVDKLRSNGLIKIRIKEENKNKSWTIK